MVSSCRDLAFSSEAEQTPPGTVRYVGVRHRTLVDGTGVTYPKPFDDRYAAIDDETVRRRGAGRERVDEIRFTPIGTPREEPWRDGEHRIRDERIEREGQREAIDVSTESVDTHFKTSMLSEVTDETTTTTFAKPRVIFGVAGPSDTVVNGVARTERRTSNVTKTRTILADGSISEEADPSSPEIESFAQAPDGRAHYSSTVVGFYSLDLTIDPPVAAATGKTIHVVRRTSGRSVGPNPTDVTAFDVPDWYPGGVIGAESDVVHVLGDAALPENCDMGSGSSRAYESDDRRTETLATGDVSTETIRTFVEADTIVCSIDDRRVRTYDPTTGLLVSMSSDELVLHLTAESATAKERRRA